MTIEFFVPVKTVSEMNVREHWRKRYERARDQRWLTRITADAACHKSQVWLPVAITMTRVGGKHMDDDNLRSATKAVRDGLADWLGINDGGNDVRWGYSEEPGGRTSSGVRVTVEPIR